MPLERLARFVLLPELKFRRVYQSFESGIFEAEKVSQFEVCPKCAGKAFGVYDRRWVTVKDAPIRGRIGVGRVRNLLQSQCQGSAKVTVRRQDFGGPYNGRVRISKASNVFKNTCNVQPVLCTGSTTNNSNWSCANASIHGLSR